MPSDQRYGAITVLLAEDDALLLELVSSRLKAEGYRVMEAGSAEQAVSILEETPADVLVTDIYLAGPLDGWSLAEQSRRLYPAILVIYMSSKPLRGTRQVRRSLYLQKPFHPDSIIDAIRQLTSSGPEPD